MTRNDDAVAEQVGGKVSSPTAGKVEEGEGEKEPLKITLKRRLDREKQWFGPEGAEGVRDRLMREKRKSGLSKEEAQEATYIELDRLFPPVEEVEEEGNVTAVADGAGESVGGPDARPRNAPDADSGRVLGLGDLPADWPILPPNASLQAEVSWVQASRVDVVEYLPSGGTRVHLDRADQPAPSKSALSWLETAVLFPSKFADVSVKATQHQEDEQEATRRERLSIEEVRGLLAEMVEAAEE